MNGRPSAVASLSVLIMRVCAQQLVTRYPCDSLANIACATLALYALCVLLVCVASYCVVCVVLYCVV